MRDSRHGFVASGTTILLAMLLAPVIASGCGSRTGLSLDVGSGGGGDVCSAITCDEPPAPECVSATVLRTSSLPGVCAVGICSYPHVDTSCPSGCMSGSCAPRTKVVSVSAGGEHTCAVTEAGAVKCWGWNVAGQLGNDSTTDSNVPVAVMGLSSGVVSVTAGESHTCALTKSGGVQCWGDNFDGELGDGTTNDSHVPLDVTSLPPGVRVVSAGGSDTCVVTSQGALECWGIDASGQLGDGTSNNSHSPIGVMGLSTGVLDVSAGRAGVVCAVAAGGAAACWGFNHYGEVGNNSTVDSHVPAGVVGLSSGVVAVSVDGSACALTSQGALKCWGSNASGDIGDGTTVESHVPADVTGLSSGVLAVAAGGNHTCAITASGALKCWGRNDLGQLGDGTTMESDVPVDVVGLSSGVVAVSAGDYHTCAITRDGALKCWGYNIKGQLGNGSSDGQSNVPVDVAL